MQMSLLLLRQIVELCMMMAMGAALVWTKLLKKEDGRAFSVAAMYLICPCVTINSFQMEPTPERVQGLILALAAAVTVHIAFFIFTGGLRRAFRLDDTEALSIIYTNAGNIILPIVSAVLGDEYIIYTSAFIAVQLTLMWTHCKSKMAGERVADWRKILTNVNLLAIVAGAVMFAARVRLPSIAAEAVSAVSRTMGPICMFSIGIVIGSADLRAVFSNRRVLLVSLLRLLVLPGLLLPLFRLASGCPVPDAKAVLLVVFLATITPSGVSVTQMAITYDRSPEEAGAINVVTTLLSAVTMPLMVMGYLA